MSDGRKELIVKFRRKSPFVKWVIISTSVFAVIICFVTSTNVGHWFKSLAQLSRQKRQIEMYRERNAELDRQIQSLSTDVDTLERFARENFLFSEPGEDVYIVEK